MTSVFCNAACRWNTDKECTRACIENDATGRCTGFMKQVSGDEGPELLDTEKDRKE